MFGRGSGAVRGSACGAARGSACGRSRGRGHGDSSLVAQPHVPVCFNFYFLSFSRYIWWVSKIVFLVFQNVLNGIYTNGRQGFWIQIRIGSRFNRVSGSGFEIRIQILGQEKKENEEKIYTFILKFFLMF
jgi:hypothetical protein